jgi:hypothetical protein
MIHSTWHQPSNVRADIGRGPARAGCRAGAATEAQKHVYRDVDARPRRAGYDYEPSGAGRGRCERGEDELVERVRRGGWR